jgi:hypothetical protein
VVETGAVVVVGGWSAADVVGVDDVVVVDDVVGVDDVVVVDDVDVLGSVVVSGGDVVSVGVAPEPVVGSVVEPLDPVVAPEPVGEVSVEVEPEPGPSGLLSGFSRGCTS